MQLVLAENPLREVEMETLFQQLRDGEERGADEVFRTRVDKIMGVLGSFAVHVLVENVNI